MQIHHWVKGQCRPGPDLVPKIAVFFNLSDAAVERMILADVRSRAEQVWRAGNSEARRMKKPRCVPGPQSRFDVFTPTGLPPEPFRGL